VRPIWDALLGLIENLLRFFYGIVDDLFGATDSWGWAIILLTVFVRVLLLPLAIKQMRSQRAMQRLAPELKKIQAKYKPDRTMMRSNPEKYRELRGKQQEATMALYKEHGVNPASGCLPLVAQMPIFIALFQVLQGRLPSDASFYFATDLTTGASALSGIEQIGAILLIGLMGLTTFFSSRQMMATTAASPEQAQQQKIMMYVMPLVLLPISWSIPVGVLLYWVTTNLWTIGQQYVMFRSREVPAAAGAQGKLRPGGAAK
jgi:YidC/Oxa1 family membrane protein insertase